LQRNIGSAILPTLGERQPALTIKQITVLGDDKPLMTATTRSPRPRLRGVARALHTVIIQAVDVEGRTSQQTVTVDVC
jgi:hypothetical protein